ncbi:MAG: molybdenum cofactor guanylyltransferase MobA [Pseudorhodoplanes sp.]|nr:molybdenum cofactor guanylyltransferase MobA [Pseudorhodoplanes sp.]
MTAEYPRTIGLILAGGMATRMGGGDKALIEIGGRTILERVLETLTPQCERILLNANGDPRRFARFGLTAIADDIPDFAGPLAGILAGLEWIARHAPGVAWMASVPGDCPFLPHDLVARLHAARTAQDKPLACARSGNWRHPVVGLWPLSLRHDLRKALVEEDLHKVEIWTARHGIAIAEWPDAPVDPFFNVNTPEDRMRAAALVAQDGDAPSRAAPDRG